MPKYSVTVLTTVEVDADSEAVARTAARNAVASVEGNGACGALRHRGGWVNADYRFSGRGKVVAVAERGRRKRPAAAAAANI